MRTDRDCFAASRRTTVPVSDVTIFPFAPGARVTTRSPTAYVAPPGAVSSSAPRRPIARHLSRASRFSSATSARRQAYMAASRPSATSAAQPATVALRAPARSGATSMQPERA